MQKRRFADRIKAVLMLDEGLSYEQVAQWDTIRNYYKTYQSEGVNALISDDNRGTWKQSEYDNILIDKFHIIKPDFSGPYMR